MYKCYRHDGMTDKTWNVLAVYVNVNGESEVVFKSFKAVVVLSRKFDFNNGYCGKAGRKGERSIIEFSNYYNKSLGDTSFILAGLLEVKKFT
ncbi:hypothetical protein SIO70_17565 [Chitinophaga sancti]|uniref:hypothetical protein n=1 Tax=Chitinophaga sancti TaxID=1004 RepID=UPI002A75179E|nr:hypothetical protein [Chitinophaga sancti]WPQ60152.1 hypothetical protein SIO70_17565 [Chitinophaga sancti]